MELLPLLLLLLAGLGSQEDFMVRDNCVVVDGQDVIQGSANKYDCHRFVEGQPAEPERDEAKLEYGGIFPEGRGSSSSTQTHGRTHANKQTTPHSPPARGRIPP